MLSQFTFSNYKSFKNEATLDFVPADIDEHVGCLLRDNKDDERFLPIIALYGTNGGGKSNVLEALVSLRNIVLSRIALSTSPGTVGDRMIKSADITNKYYKFDNRCETAPIEFDVLFRTFRNEYRYQLAIVGHSIIKENLYMRPIAEENAVLVFERSRHDCNAGEILNGMRVDKVNNTMPLLSHIAINYDIDVIKDAVGWFERLHCLNYDALDLDKRAMIPNDERLKNVFLQALQEVEIPITGLRIEKDVFGSVTNIYTQRVLSNGLTKELNLNDESSGTIKLFNLMPQLIECLSMGKFVIVDEMDAKLHPKLLGYIIRLFTNPAINRHGAQLLFTSHDMTTMSPRLFRRDEIWFCAQGADNSSYLYSLVSFKQEYTDNTDMEDLYRKQYLAGRYGADPFLKRIINWESLMK